MKVQLQVVSGAKKAKVTLRLPTIIGRARDARVKLRDSKVSRHHCELYEYEGQLAVRDLGSSNGTIVNGHRIEDPVLMGPEDTLTVGPVTFGLSTAPVDPSAADTDIQDASAAHAPSADHPDIAEPAEDQTTEDLPAHTESVGAEPNADSDVLSAEPREAESEIDYDETDEGSFIGIRSIEGAGPGGPSLRDDPSVGLAGDHVDEPSRVDPQDSDLGRFLKGFE